MARNRSEDNVSPWDLIIAEKKRCAVSVSESPLGVVGKDLRHLGAVLRRRWYEGLENDAIPTSITGCDVIDACSELFQSVADRLIETERRLSVLSELFSSVNTLDFPAKLKNSSCVIETNWSEHFEMIQGDEDLLNILNHMDAASLELLIRIFHSVDPSDKSGKNEERLGLLINWGLIVDSCYSTEEENRTEYGKGWVEITDRGRRLIQIIRFSNKSSEG